MEENILRLEEKTEISQKLPPKERWYREMSKESKKDFYGQLLVFPLMVFVTFFVMTGVPFNILFIYLISDIVVFCICRSDEVKRLEELDRIERMGGPTEYLNKIEANFLEWYSENLVREQEEKRERERLEAAKKAKRETKKRAFLMALPHFHYLNKLPENTNLGV